MTAEENFDDLKNIHKNIEMKLKSVQQSNENQINKEYREDNSEIIEQINKEKCTKEINQFEKNLTENNAKLKEMIKQEKEIIKKYIEDFINKVESETNEHIKLIESLNLTEEEKQAEYIKCIEQLDNIISLNEALKNSVMKSEENLLSFLNYSNNPNKDIISDFLLQNLINLKVNNIYNQFHYSQKNDENIFNDMKNPKIRNNIIKSFLENGKNLHLHKLKINKYSNLENIKELLLITNWDKIEKISIKDLSRKDFKYLFNKEKIKKKPFDFSRSLFRSTISGKIGESVFAQERLPSLALKSKERLSLNNSTLIVDHSKDDEFKSSISPIYINKEYKYKKVHIKKCDLTEQNLDDLFNNMNKLKITSCKLSFDFYGIKKNFNFSNVTELYLDDCGFVNENFNEIIYSIINNEKLRKNLKCLSFKNNHIITLKFFRFFMQGEIKKYIFDNLELLDFSDNQLKYLEGEISDVIPNIKLIDLSNNDFHLNVFGSLFKLNKKIIENQESQIKENNPNPVGFLILLSNNPALLKGDLMHEYLNHLTKTLENYHYPLKRINLSGLFCNCKEHQDLFNIIKLKNFQKTLVDINLSSCDLTDEKLANFLLNNCIINIKKINLTNNKLTDNLFKLLSEKKSFYDIYNNIKIIDLSVNDIKLNNVQDVKNFVRFFDSIHKIIIKSTIAEDNINNFIRKSIIIFNEKQNAVKNISQYNYQELLVKDLIENKNNKQDNLWNNNNIKIIMKNTIDYKFIEAAQKIYQDFFEKIVIENQVSFH
jgi:hypothetical protein